MSTILDSAVFGPLFRAEEVSLLLSDEAYVGALMQVESALARAQAKLGIIPAAAAESIAKVMIDQIDIGALAKGTARSGFPIIALVQELRKQAGEEAAPYLHWGATTQDIMDTACVLQIRASMQIYRRMISEIARDLSALAERHRTTILAARTHGQQALPISFGFKAAGWLMPLIRHLDRLDELSPRLLALQFGGAAGTLAALGDKGLAVAQALAEDLELAVPVMPWHVQRDSLVEFAGWLCLLTGSLGKMAQDIILLVQTEIGEMAESAEEGRGGSSTMPQKSNPITSELIVAAARTNASLVSAMHQAQIQENERATHGWQVEWLVLPQMMLLTGGALKHALYLAKNLQVDAAAMRDNISRANDVILAEAAVFSLTRFMPRAEAEDLVKKACGIAASQARPMLQVAKELAAGHAGAVDWAALQNPANYLGQADKMIDRVLQRLKDRI